MADSGDVGCGGPVTVARFDPAWRPAVEHIFFATSATRNHPTPAARAAFRERWLDRYLDHHPDAAFVAVASGTGPVGYVIGALHDPARDQRFDDIGYFRVLAELTARFPAHLHVNVLEAWQGHGIGTRLVDRFASHAAGTGAPGVHVVTASGARNVAFYRRSGFHPVHTFDWRGAQLLMLARTLGGADV